MMNSSWQQRVFEFYAHKQTDIREDNGNIDALTEKILGEAAAALRILRNSLSTVREADVRIEVAVDLLQPLEMLLRGMSGRSIVATSEQTASLLYQVVAVSVIFNLPLDSLFNELHASRHGGFPPDTVRVLKNAGLWR